VESFGFTYGGDISQDELVAKVRELNADPKVHGEYY